MPNRTKRHSMGGQRNPRSRQPITAIGPASLPYRSQLDGDRRRTSIQRAMRVSELLTESIPVISETESVGSALAMLRDATFAEYDHIYLTDDAGRMTGQV